MSNIVDADIFSVNSVGFIDVTSN